MTERNYMKKFQKLALALVMAAALAAPIVWAQSTGDSAQNEQQPRMRGHRGRGDRMGGRLFRQLDLTEAQQAQIKQIRENHRQSIEPLVQEIRAKRQEIRQASQGGTVNEALVQQKLTEIAPLEAKLMAERAKLHQEMLAVLTPEQKAKLEQLREQFKARRDARKAGKTL
ncbi:MAG TPA: Spy/CpxP family protein refolding chaperone [Blastocatellia bacterium]|nr:Spy/CpxP family protein refolding chaperone [Blastocatellia bacterium]